MCGTRCRPTIRAIGPANARTRTHPKGEDRMARRSVSLPPNLERTVRRLQATLLTTMDRDISFTETLNLALAAAFAVPDLARRVTTEEWQDLLDGSDWDADGILAKKKREILDAISDQRSTAVSPDAESESEAPVAVEEPALPIALAAPAEAPAAPAEAPMAPAEADQAPDPDVTWEEPARAGHGGRLLYLRRAPGL